MPNTAAGEAGAIDIRGTNQRGVRAYNERLALTLVRWLGPMSKAEIAKRTGLSPQTTSIIMRDLEESGLIVRQAPIRGRVGQPSVPFALAPDGALFFGLKIGRRSSEVLLIDFEGVERASRVLSYHHPTPDEVVSFARRSLGEIMSELDAEAGSRIQGLGIATPFEMWNWPAMIGLPEDEMAEWQDRDIVADITAFCDFPVHLANDGSAACSAELLFGTGETALDFLYAYIGFFVGGGLVIDGSLYQGRSGNAAALASVLVPAPGGGSRQLIEPASIATLERRIRHERGTQHFLTDHGDWNVPARALTSWLEDAAEALATAAIAAAALLDLRTVVIDGWLPPDLREDLVARTARAIAGRDTAGIVAPRVVEGSLGPRARCLGAAALVLSSRYMVDQTATVRGA